MSLQLYIQQSRNLHDFVCVNDSSDVTAQSVLELLGELPAHRRLDVTCGLRASHIRPVTNDNGRHSRFDGQTAASVCTTARVNLN